MFSAMCEYVSFSTPLTILNIVIFKLPANIGALNMVPYCLPICIEEISQTEIQENLHSSSEYIFILWMLGLVTLLSLLG